MLSSLVNATQMKREATSYKMALLAAEAATAATAKNCLIFLARTKRAQNVRPCRKTTRGDLISQHVNSPGNTLSWLCFPITYLILVVYVVM